MKHLNYEYLYIKEYEREMKSYGIPVKQVTVEDFQDQNDLNGTVGVTKVCTYRYTNAKQQYVFISEMFYYSR